MMVGFRRAEIIPHHLCADIGPLHPFQESLPCLEQHHRTYVHACVLTIDQLQSQEFSVIVATGY